jgi:hypothetical protein
VEDVTVQVLLSLAVEPPFATLTTNLCVPAEIPE